MCANAIAQHTRGSLQPGAGWRADGKYEGEGTVSFTAGVAVKAQWVDGKMQVQ